MKTNEELKKINEILEKKVDLLEDALSNAVYYISEVTLVDEDEWIEWLTEEIGLNFDEDEYFDISQTKEMLELDKLLEDLK